MNRCPRCGLSPCVSRQCTEIVELMRCHFELIVLKHEQRVAAGR